MKAVVAYIPALHAAYLEFFNQNSDAILYLVSDSVVENIAGKIPYYGRDVRALPSDTTKGIIQSLGIFEEVRNLSLDSKDDLKEFDEIIMPDEDISSEIINLFDISEEKVRFNMIFLRWNRRITEKEYEVTPEEEISEADFDKKMMRLANSEADKTSDWWRQIGAVIEKDEGVISLAHNTHLPNEDNPNVVGDPRSVYDAGERYDLASSIHAEASAIAKAAKQGVSLNKANIYVTTFPCPTCAKLISQSGIRKLYFRDGYSLLDAEDILKNSGVKIIRIKEN